MPPQRTSGTDDRNAFAHERALMVERYIKGRGVHDERILQAMRDVPRHMFVPPAVASKAYGDSPLPIGQRQTISQPFIVAKMIELLELRGDEKVLEIGTGTGYQACVLARLAARVYSIERISELAFTARDIMRRLAVNNVSVKVFDGTYGWSDQAPFDRIIVAAAGPEIPEPLIAQLARSGRMVLPIGPEGNQRLARVYRVGTQLKIEDCGGVEFVPLIGRFGWKEG